MYPSLSSSVVPIKVCHPLYYSNRHGWLLSVMPFMYTVTSCSKSLQGKQSLTDGHGNSTKKWLMDPSTQIYQVTKIVNMELNLEKG